MVILWINRKEKILASPYLNVTKMNLFSRENLNVYALPICLLARNFMIQSSCVKSLGTVKITAINVYTSCVRISKMLILNVANFLKFLAKQTV